MQNVELHIFEHFERLVFFFFLGKDLPALLCIKRTLISGPERAQSVFYTSIHHLLLLQTEKKKKPNGRGIKKNQRSSRHCSVQHDLFFTTPMTSAFVRCHLHLTNGVASSPTACTEPKLAYGMRSPIVPTLHTRDWPLALLCLRCAWKTRSPR
jgi:hypothetical protein